MPNVPVYNTPTVSPSDLPGFRQQAPSRTSLMQSASLAGEQAEALGNAGVRAGVVALNIMTEEQIQANETRAKDFDTQQVTSNDAILHGSADGSTKGFLALQGQAAVDAYDDTVKRLQSVPRDLSPGLENTTQQRLVSNTSQLRLNAAMTQAKIHRDQQLRVASQAADDARTKVGADSAAKSFNPITDSAKLNFNNDAPDQNSAYQQGLQTVVSSTRSRYADMPPEVIEEKVKEALGRTYVATIGHMLDGKGNDLAAMTSAKDYFDKIKDDLPVEVADKIGAHLQKGSVLANAQASADAIGDRFGGDMAGALAEVRKITNPEVREKTESLVKERFNTDEMIKQRQMRDADNAGLLQITNGGSLRQLMASPVWSGMSAHAQHQAEEWVRAKQLHGAQMSQIDKMNDLVGLQKVLQLRQDNPAQFANLDMVATSRELGIKSPATVKQLIEVQASYNKGDAAEATFNTAFKNARTLYSPLLVQAGIAPLPNMDKEKKAAAEGNVATFESQVQSDIQSWMKDNGNKIPDGKVLQGIIQQNLTPVFIHGTGSWFGLGDDKSKPLGITKPEERQKAYVVSASELQKQSPTQYAQVVNGLKARLGRNPTPSEVENQYTQMVLMLKGK